MHSMALGGAVEMLLFFASIVLSIHPHVYLAAASNSIRPKFRPSCLCVQIWKKTQIGTNTGLYFVIAVANNS